MLFKQGVPPYASYLFKHALVQDAAYGTLLREPRRVLHAQIAETLESQFTEIAENQPERANLLGALAEREISTMIDGVTGNKPLPALDNVLSDARTDGIPLFIEEMTKAVLEGFARVTA